MSRSPRAEALHLIENDMLIPPPESPGLQRNSDEAMEFLASIKPSHYASLAKAIDLLFEHALSQRDDEAPYGLSQSRSPYITVNGWMEFAEDFRATFMNSRDAIQETSTYKTAGAYADLIGSLDSNRWINLDWQLDGGVGTGVVSTLTLLRNIPRVVRHHAADSSMAEVSEIARHASSQIVLRKLAKVSINQMMAAQSVLAGETIQHHSWSNQRLNTVLDPELFQLNSDPGGQLSLGYAGFDSLTVPEGYTPHRTVPPMEKTTLVRDIPGHQPVTVGCPVTLLHGRLSELYNWSLDIIESEKLWETGWPLPRHNHVSVD